MPWQSHSPCDAQKSEVVFLGRPLKGKSGAVESTRYGGVLETFPIMGTLPRENSCGAKVKCFVRKTVTRVPTGDLPWFLVKPNRGRPAKGDLVELRRPVFSNVGPKSVT